MRHIAIGVLVAMGLASCETFTDFGLKNATWSLYHIGTAGETVNLMTLRMEGYRDNDPAYRYLIHFAGGDRCTGTYYAADTLSYEVEGTWSLPEHDILRIKLDGMVDGDFKITKLERHVFYLHTDRNYHGLDIEPPYLPLDMYIERQY